MGFWTERKERHGKDGTWDRGEDRGGEPEAGGSEAGGVGVSSQGVISGRAEAEEAPGAQQPCHYHPG